MRFQWNPDDGSSFLNWLHGRFDRFFEKKGQASRKQTHISLKDSLRIGRRITSIRSSEISDSDFIVYERLKSIPKRQ